MAGPVGKGVNLMKIKLIGCASVLNEIQWIGTLENVDYEILDYTYHANPAKLHAKLQELINESQDYDLIILTYGRCSNAVVGLVSPKVPLLLPATDDCIGLLLGSGERHMQLFRENPGTYYFSRGWLDYGRDPYTEYKEYEKKYGEKKARYLIDTLYGRYTKAVLIKTPGKREMEYYRKRVREIADFFGWQVDEVEGDIGLLDSLLKCSRVPGTVLVEPNTAVSADLWAWWMCKPCDP